MKKGSELGMTAENADKYFNFGTDGSINDLLWRWYEYSLILGETNRKIMAQRAFEVHRRICTRKLYCRNLSKAQ